jgi:hypothetical protein
MVVWGTRFCGPVDKLEGYGEVRTRFFHIWFLPLLPLGSTFVVEDLPDGVRGFKVGLSLKSVFLAWSRTGLLFAMLGLGFVAFDQLVAFTEFAPVIAKQLRGGGLKREWGLPLAKSVAGMGGGLCGLPFAVLVWWGLGALLGRPGAARRAELLARLGAGGGLDAPVVPD